MAGLASTGAVGMPCGIVGTTNVGTVDFEGDKDGRV